MSASVICVALSALFAPVLASSWHAGEAVHPRRDHPRGRRAETPRGQPRTRIRLMSEAEGLPMGNRTQRISSEHTAPRARSESGAVKRSRRPADMLAGLRDATSGESRQRVRSSYRQVSLTAVMTTNNFYWRARYHRQSINDHCVAAHWSVSSCLRHSTRVAGFRRQPPVRRRLVCAAAVYPNRTVLNAATARSRQAL